MVVSLGIALVLVALVSLVVLRMTVGFLARGADNGWDNALTYVVATGLAWAGLIHFVMPLGVVSFALGAALMPLVQIGLLRWIYEIRVGRALVVGLVHTTIGASIITAMTLVAGVIAAYVLYGRVINDPMMLVRIILRLIGLLPGTGTEEVSSLLGDLTSLVG